MQTPITSLIEKSINLANDELKAQVNQFLTFSLGLDIKYEVICDEPSSNLAKIKGTEVYFTLVNDFDLCLVRYGYPKDKLKISTENPILSFGQNLIDLERLGCML